MYIVFSKNGNLVTRKVYVLWSTLLIDIVVGMSTFDILEKRGEWQTSDGKNITIIYKEGTWPCI